MKKKEFRKRKVSNDYRRALLKKGIKITVSQAYKETTAIEIIARAVGPLSAWQRDKVFRMVIIAIEPPPTARGEDRENDHQ